MKTKYLIAIAVIGSIVSWLTNPIVVSFFVTFLIGIFGTTMDADDVRQYNRDAEEHNKSWFSKKQMKSVSLAAVIRIGVVISVFLLAFGLGVGIHLFNNLATTELLIFLGCISGSITSFYCLKENSVRNCIAVS